MREIVLNVRAGVAEAVLDRLLPIVPAGVREMRDGEDVELRMRGAGLPELAEVAQLVRRLPHTLSEHEVPDDWRTRRVADYRQEVIGGRLVVRPEWAPPAGEGLIDIALSDDTAFGSGAHPSTHAILQALLEIEPCGSFADLGCGSGVLGILAAKLGWAPVTGLEIIEYSVESARANVRRNNVEMAVAVADLSECPPPPADAFAANLPGPVHIRLAGAPELQSASRGIISGFGPTREPELIAAYTRAGFGITDHQVLHGWSVITLRRG